MENKQGKSLVELKITLEEPEEAYFNFSKGSLLQGVLFEHINADYAEELHNQGLKPYSQFIRTEDGNVNWYVRTLSGQAYQQIVVPLLSEEFQEFDIEHDKQHIKILKKEVKTTSIDALFQKFYSEEANRYLNVEFISPTAFKKNGKYSFYPEMFNVYQSLMKKFDAASEKAGMFSEETLEQLAENTEIVDYNLRSIRFSLEGVRIPAFLGRMRIRIHGTQTMVNFAKLLFEFGNYSGVGIKTAIGMGSIRVTEQKRRDSK